MTEMENKKKRLIEHWEFQKYLIVCYGVDSDTASEIYKYANTLFSYAVNEYGYDWAKANLTPLDLATFDITRFH